MNKLEAIWQAIINTGRGLPASSPAWRTIVNISHRTGENAHRRSVKAASKEYIAC
jgi:hypothetical protein